MVALTDILPTEGYVETLVRKDSGIKNYKDLEGKTVATINLQGLFETAIRHAVEKEGGDPKNVKTLAMSPADEGPALEAGRLDAIILQDPFLAQAKANPDFVSLGNPFALFDYPVLSGALYSSDKIIAEKGDALKRFHEALTEASKTTQADPQLARDIIPTYTELTPDVVETIGLPEYTTEMPPEALTKLLGQMETYGFVKDVPPEDQLVWTGD
jgi:NitT/TauT family transport system substrate-binding protein